MNEKQLAEEIHELRQDLKIVFLMEAIMANELANLQAAVQQNGALVDQAVALLQELVANPVTGGIDPAAVQAQADALATQNAALQAEIVATTPANGPVVNPQSVTLANGQVVYPSTNNPVVNTRTGMRAVTQPDGTVVYQPATQPEAFRGPVGPSSGIQSNPSYKNLK